MGRRSVIGAVLLVAMTCAQFAVAQDRPLVEQYLISGKLAEGETALDQHLKQNPQDDQARFGLGTLQVIRGVERLMQNLYAAGMKSERSGGIPFLRLPVPENP